MRRILSHGRQTIELVRLGQAPPAEEAALSSRAGIAALLRSFIQDPLNMATLRRALAEEAGRQQVSRLRDGEVVEQLAAQIARGRLRIARHARLRAVLPPPPVRAWQGTAVKEEEEPVVLASTTGPPPAAAPAGSWIKVQVVDDATDQPVSGVTFALTLPDGTHKEVVTNAGGVAELTGLTPGSFTIERMADEDGWEVLAVA